MLPILVAFTLAVTPAASPLVADPPAADRGEVRSGPQLTQEFTLTHRGESGIITITDIKPGCGCLNPVVSQKVLRPGESVKLSMTVNTLTQPPGANTWHATIRYSSSGAGGASPTAHELEVKILARLVQEVSVTPPALAISTSGETTQTIIVTDRRETPLTVREASTTSPHLTAKVLPASTTTPGTQVVSVTVQANLTPGQSHETLVLVTTDPSCPELRVPIRVTRRPPDDVIATPATAVVRFARGQDAASRLVQLRKPGGGQIRIERVDSDHPSVSAKWSDTSGPVVTVRVVVDAAKTQGAQGQAVIQVRLAEPAGETVVLPVTWAVPQ